MDVLEKIALWVGWAPVAIFELAIMLLAKFMYDRVLSIKDSSIHRCTIEIQNQKNEIENLKQSQVDSLVLSLADRVRIANEEVERLRADKSTSVEVMEKKEKELQGLHGEVQALKTQLRNYENGLSDLLDTLDYDYCDICSPDEEHLAAKFIDWHDDGGYTLSGDVALVKEVGICNYCNSPQIRCRVCGVITSIDINASEEQECMGGCGNTYEVIPYREDKEMLYSIRVSRLNVDDEVINP